MEEMGPRTIKPFSQDVVRFDGLIGSSAKSFVADPGFAPHVIAHVGIPPLVEWIGRVGMMGIHGLLDAAAAPAAIAIVDKMKDPRARFEQRRRFEAWKFGSGNDSQLPEEN
jgi:hypothetical protein